MPNQIMSLLKNHRHLSAFFFFISAHTKLQGLPICHTLPCNAIVSTPHPLMPAKLDPLFRSQCRCHILGSCPRRTSSPPPKLGYVLSYMLPRNLRIPPLTLECSLSLFSFPLVPKQINSLGLHGIFLFPILFFLYLGTPRSITGGAHSYPLLWVSTASNPGAWNCVLY